MDVSRDGGWIVWTTKKYIAIISSEFKDADGHMASGFEVCGVMWDVALGGVV